MPRRPVVPRRPAIFVGAEGDGERSFARWLQELIAASGSLLHLDVHVLGGGDSLVLVNAALQRRARGGTYLGSLLLLDEDRLLGDGTRGDDAVRMAQAAQLTLIWQRPNQEGVLLRLFQGHEQRSPAADVALRELQREWPGYRKPTSARALAQRFVAEDLRRAARFDPNLSRLILIIGL